MNTITPSFMTKYISMTIFTSFAVNFVYKYFKNNVKINKNVNYDKEKLWKNNIFFIIFIFINLDLLYFIRLYKDVPPEQFAFHLQVPVEGTSFNIIWHFLSQSLLPTLNVVILLYLQYIIFKKLKLNITAKIRNKTFTIFPILYFKKIFKIFILLCTLVVLIYTAHNYNIIEFITNQFVISELIEDEYVNPNDVSINFPNQKRNLIYIYLESMETSFSDYTPNLNIVAKNNTIFSNSSPYGGFYELTGTNWTIASMVAQTSGLPLKFSIESNSYNASKNTFLNGVDTLGEILTDNGYKNYLYIGSDANFAARKLYFETHGNYEILDYVKAKEENYIDSDYGVWWGYEDKKLYEFSKEKLTALAKEKEPFNFTLLTVDTHPEEGYLDETCKRNYNDQYANVVLCADEMVYDFVSWIQKQSFYKNTTIVITGDHLYMAKLKILENVKDKDRFIYNVVINSPVKYNSEVTHDYSALDLFPTTLAALGVKIEGNRLGLGVNLYSNELTIIEKYGYNYVDNELKKKSSFYKNLSLYN